MHVRFRENESDHVGALNQRIKCTGKVASKRRGQCRRMPGSALALMLLTVAFFSPATTTLRAQPADSCTISSVPSNNNCQGNRIIVDVKTMDKIGCQNKWCDGLTYCNNCCEQCCLYFFELTNNDQNHKKVVKVGLCTDLGCAQAAVPPGAVWQCNSGVIPFIADHICTFCGIERTTPTLTDMNAWVEDPICGGPVYSAKLCSTNCIRFLPTAPGKQLDPGDRLEMRVGLTGDCHDRQRPTDIGVVRRKCVMVCAQFDDGTEACCMVYPPHCICITDGLGCTDCLSQDPATCSQDYFGAFPKTDCNYGGGGTRAKRGNSGNGSTTPTLSGSACQRSGSAAPALSGATRGDH